MPACSFHQLLTFVLPALALFFALLLASAGRAVAQSATTVTITSAGPSPATVGVTAGGSVTWVNQTGETLRVAAGSPYRLFAPLAPLNDLRRASAAAPVRSAADVTWSGDLAPGASYTRAFAGAATVSYFVSPHFTWLGTVNVAYAPGQPTFTPTATPSPTATPTYAPVSTVLPANQTTTIAVTTSNHAVTVNVPPGVAQVNGQAVAVQIDVKSVATPPPSAVGAVGVGLKAVEIDMQTLDGQKITQLAKPMTIELTYTDDELAANGIDAAALQLSYSSDGGVTWQTLPTTVDAANHRAYATVDHLTRFSLGGRPRATATPTPSPSPSGTLSPTGIASATGTATRRPTSTITETPAPTPSPTPSLTPSPSVSPTPTPSASPTPTLTGTPTGTAPATAFPSSTIAPSPTPSGTATRSPTATVTPSPTPLTSVAISISGFAFVPPTVTAAAGQRVVWTNADGVLHRIASATGGWTAGDVVPDGGTFGLTFGGAGSYSYFCEIHPSMVGVVVVLTPTAPPMATSSPSRTATPVAAPSSTLTSTASPTLAPTLSSAATATLTARPTQTLTRTPSQTARLTPTGTASASPTASRTPTSTASPSVTVTGTPTLPIIQAPSTISIDTTWPGGFTYLSNGTGISSGATLTIQPGAVVKFRPDAGLVVYGTLSAQGTSANPVVFTSLKDDAYGGDTNRDGAATSPAPADWGQIKVYGTATLDHAVVRYGGCVVSCPYDEARTALLNVASGTLTLTNSTVADNSGYGVYHGGGSSTPTTTIHGTSIYGHTRYGAYNASTATTVDATSNWWGSDSGPAPFGSGNGVNSRVNVSPWSGQGNANAPQVGRGGPVTKYQAHVGDPVNTANGNYAYQRTDLAIPTLGLPLDFGRSYNSLAPTPGPLGWGWMHGWNLGLAENSTDGSVVVTFGDGHTESWLRDGGTYRGATAVLGALGKNADGTFDLVQKDQTRLRFTATGKLAYAQDRNANRTTLTYDSTGRLTTVTEPAGRTLTFAYTSSVDSSLISRVTDPLNRTIQLAYDANSNLMSVTDTAGAATTMTYDANHRLLTMTDANSHTFLTNLYDSQGRVTQQRDALTNATTFAYDTTNLRTTVTDARANATVYQYGADGRLTAETDALGGTASYGYDADGNRTLAADKRGNSTRSAYDAKGNIVAVTDALGFNRTFSYDAQNNLLGQTDARGSTTTFQYDTNGNRTARTDPLGNTTRWTYSTTGQVLTAVDARANTTSYAYNANGYPVSTIDALSGVTTSTYDAGGRKLSERDPLGSTTTYQYDAAGNRTRTTDARGNATSYTYDTLNRLTRVTDALNGAVAYAYDGEGNRTSMTDAKSHTTTYAYDALSRLTATTDPLNQTTRRTYDAAGNLATTIKADGTVLTYAYDALNRQAGLSSAGLSVAYAYDAAGNRTSLVDATGTTAFAYDALHRMTSATDPAGRAVGYGYDAVGNRTRLTYPGGQIVTYAYDNANRLTTVTDWANKVTTYSYDNANQVATAALPNGTTTTYTRNIAGWVTGLGHAAGGTSFASFNYTYDAAGDRLTEAATAGTATYAYDALQRLTSVTYPGSEQVTYAYDLAGNRTTQTSSIGGTTNYTYDAADRMTAAGSDAYTWDAVGRVASKANGGVTTTYSFDQINRLTQLSVGSGSTSFTYNGDGVRVGKATGAAITSYVQDLAAPLPLVLVERTGGQDTLYLYGLGVITQEKPDGTRRYHHADALGSARVLTDDTGAVSDRYDYDAFGATRARVGASADPFTFAGEQADTETGLQFLRARYYDPSTGRFLSRDDFPGHDLLTQSRNRYAYANNNPVTYTDADGHFWNFVAGAGIGVLEYTAGVAVKNVIEGKPISHSLDGWDAGEAAISGVRGAVTYGLGLGPAGSALVDGVAGAIISVRHQQEDKHGTLSLWDVGSSRVGSLADVSGVDPGRAVSDGIVDGLLSFGVDKLVPGVRGRQPKNFVASFSGAHAEREWVKAGIGVAVDIGRSALMDSQRGGWDIAPISAYAYDGGFAYGSHSAVSSGGFGGVTAGSSK